MSCLWKINGLSSSSSSALDLTAGFNRSLPPTYVPVSVFEAFEEMVYLFFSFFFETKVLWQGCWNRFLAMGHIKLLDCERE
jgi:hypothetical protein